MARADAPAKHRERSRALRPAPRSAWQNPWLIAGIVAALLALVGVFALAGRSTMPSGPQASSADLAAVQSAVTSSDQAVMAAVGSGGLPNPLMPASGVSALAGPGGRPEVLYIGAEWCPYCAAERWSLAVALARLGTLSGLQLTTSSSSDVFPNTPTLSFSGTQYASQFLDFVPVETQNRAQQPLENPTPEQLQIEGQLDPDRSIPFVDVGNRYFATDAGFGADVLSGKSWMDVAKALPDSSSPVTQAIVGNANWLTAAMCKLTTDQPANICAAPAIDQLAAQLGG